MGSKYFFFRLNAAQATIVVGIFEVISILQALLGLGFCLSFLSFGEHEIEHELQEEKNMEFWKNLHSYSDLWSHFLWTSTIFYGFCLIFPSLLIVGVLKENTFYTLPWVIVSWLRAFLGILLYVPMFLLSFSGLVLFFYFSFVTIGYAFVIYSLHVVNEYHAQCKRSSSSDAESVVYHNF
ncbi:uncharacterized protein LOC132204395 [Neocloeon triangulifer]|uniref:uncharacterized protein LOC132204395 n=1 Tax=Neocloeon triangulifer TaxID=2078957 RepID=UPI00286F3639|nr:uncharacterized protein LOC132204395 [Neocloeon triangulifer]